MCILELCWLARWSPILHMAWDGRILRLPHSRWRRRMVQTYLVHHGYCATAEAFANSTGIGIEEDLASIRSRQSKCLEGEVHELHTCVKVIICWKMIIWQSFYFYIWKTPKVANTFSRIPLQALLVFFMHKNKNFALIWSFSII